MMRLRHMFQQAPGFMCLLTGPQHTIEFTNNAHDLLFGSPNRCGDTWNNAFGVTVLETTPHLLDHVYATGKRHIARGRRVKLQRAPGAPAEERFLDYVIEPIIGDNAQTTGLFIEGFDVTEMIHARAAAEESQTRLTAAVSLARLGVIEWRLDAQAVTLDARAREIFGFEAKESPSLADLVARIGGNDYERICAEIAAARSTGSAGRQCEYRVHLPDGTAREVSAVVQHWTRPTGEIWRMVGVLDDVTEQRRAEDLQRLLINELNHRVKNTLAAVQSIAAQTLRSAPDLAIGRELFESRLLALSSAHNLLTVEGWQGASLDEIAMSSVAPFESAQRPQIVRSGPATWLPPGKALALSLALHELATNAARYGSLSTQRGRVHLRWAEVEGQLVLTWIEQRGPPVEPPERSGFGTRLLQRSLARELNGDVSFFFAREGFRCEIRFNIGDAEDAPSRFLVEQRGPGFDAPKPWSRRRPINGRSELP